jgi:hypothetical protein
MFADIEAAIIARLQAKLPAGTYVASLDDLERVPEMRQRTPAAWVVYDGYTVDKRIPSVPSVAQIRQTWYVVIATKSAKGAGGVNAAKDAAGSLTTTALQALLGFDLGAGKYLQVEEAPGPEYDGGYCHVPLAFSNAATFKGQP